MRTTSALHIGHVGGVMLAGLVATLPAQAAVDTDAVTPLEFESEVRLVPERVPDALMQRWLRADSRLSMAAPQVTRLDVSTTSDRSVPGTGVVPGSRAELSGVSYRWWTSRGQADWGVGVGSTGYVVRQLGDTGAEPRAVVGAAPTLSVGVRYRATDTSALYADAANARGLGAEGRNLYVGKVGVEWKSAQSRFNFLRGGLNYQLDNGSRMTLKLRKGQVGIFMRSEF